MTRFILPFQIDGESLTITTAITKCGPDQFGINAQINRKADKAQRRLSYGIACSPYQNIIDAYMIANTNEELESVWTFGPIKVSLFTTVFMDRRTSTLSVWSIVNVYDTELKHHHLRSTHVFSSIDHNGDVDTSKGLRLMTGDALLNLTNGFKANKLCVSFDGAEDQP